MTLLLMRIDMCKTKSKERKVWSTGIITLRILKTLYQKLINLRKRDRSTTLTTTRWSNSLHQDSQKSIQDRNLTYSHSLLYQSKLVGRIMFTDKILFQFNRLIRPHTLWTRTTLSRIKPTHSKLSKMETNAMEIHVSNKSLIILTRYIKSQLL